MNRIIGTSVGRLDAPAKAADEITEEFRTGNARTLSDDAVRDKVAAILQRYRHTVQCIAEYEASNS